MAKSNPELRKLIIQTMKNAETADKAKHGNNANIFRYCTWWFKCDADSSISTSTYRRELRLMEQDGLVKSIELRKGNIAWALV